MDLAEHDAGYVWENRGDGLHRVDETSRGGERIRFLRSSVVFSDQPPGPEDQVWRMSPVLTLRFEPREE